MAKKGSSSAPKGDVYAGGTKSLSKEIQLLKQSVILNKSSYETAKSQTEEYDEQGRILKENNKELQKLIDKGDELDEQQKERKKKLEEDNKLIEENLKLKKDDYDKNKDIVDVQEKQQRRLKNLVEEQKKKLKLIQQELDDYDSIDSSVQSLGASVGKNNKLYAQSLARNEQLKVVQQSISQVLQNRTDLTDRDREGIVKIIQSRKEEQKSINDSIAAQARGEISREQMNDLIVRARDEQKSIESSIVLSENAQSAFNEVLAAGQNEMESFANAAKKSSANMQLLDKAMDSFSGVPVMGELNTLLNTNIKDTLAFKAAVFALGAALGKAAFDYFGAPFKVAQKAQYEIARNQIETAKNVRGIQVEAGFVRQKIEHEIEKNQIDTANNVARAQIEAGFAVTKAMNQFNASLKQGAAQFAAASKTALFGKGIGSVGYATDQMQLAGVGAEKVASAMEAAGAATGRMPTAKLGADMAIMAERTGQSVDSIAQINEYFQRTDNVSAKVAMNMQEGLRAMADQAGIGLGNLMREVAEASKEALSYNIKSGPALAKQVAYAQSLGVNFGDIAKAGKNMVMNYKDSIKAEMKLSTLLGEQVDLSEVRAKFASGDQKGALEALKATGLDVENMDMFQLDALQESLGGMDIQSIQKAMKGEGAAVGDLKAGDAQKGGKDFLQAKTGAEKELQAKQAQISAAEAIIDASLSGKITEAYLKSPAYLKYQKEQSKLAEKEAELAGQIERAKLADPEMQKMEAKLMQLDFKQQIKENLMSGFAMLAGGLLTTMASKLAMPVANGIGKVITSPFKMVGKLVTAPFRLVGKGVSGITSMLGKGVRGIGKGLSNVTGFVGKKLSGITSIGGKKDKDSAPKKGGIFGKIKGLFGIGKKKKGGKEEAPQVQEQESLGASGALFSKSNPGYVISIGGAAAEETGAKMFIEEEEPAQQMKGIPQPVEAKDNQKGFFAKMKDGFTSIFKKKPKDQSGKETKGFFSKLTGGFTSMFKKKPEGQDSGELLDRIKQMKAESPGMGTKEALEAIRSQQGDSGKETKGFFSKLTGGFTSMFKKKPDDGTEKESKGFFSKLSTGFTNIFKKKPDDGGKKETKGFFSKLTGGFTSMFKKKPNEAEDKGALLDRIQSMKASNPGMGSKEALAAISAQDVENQKSSKGFFGRLQTGFTDIFKKQNKNADEQQTQSKGFFSKLTGGFTGLFKKKPDDGTEKETKGFFGRMNDGFTGLFKKKPDETGDKGALLDRIQSMKAESPGMGSKEALAAIRAQDAENQKSSKGFFGRLQSGFTGIFKKQSKNADQQQKQSKGFFGRMTDGFTSMFKKKPDEAQDKGALLDRVRSMKAASPGMGSKEALDIIRTQDAESQKQSKGFFGRMTDGFTGLFKKKETAEGAPAPEKKGFLGKMKDGISGIFGGGGNGEEGGAPKKGIFGKIKGAVGGMFGKGDQKEAEPPKEQKAGGEALGGATEDVASAAPDAGPAATTIEAIGKVGPGIGATLSGIASGLAAFANPLILVGAGILAGSITLIGAGIAGAVWIIGKALPTMAEGFKAFNEIDGQNLKAIGIGMAAFGAGMLAFSAGALIGAVAGIVQGIGSLFGGGPGPIEQFVEFSKLDIGDPEKVGKNAEAFSAFAKGMALAGGAKMLGGLGMIAEGIGAFFGGKPPLEKFKEFSEMKVANPKDIKPKAEAFTTFAEALGKYTGTGQGIMGVLAEGIGNFLKNEDPIKKFEKFAQLKIDGANVKNSAEAFAAFGNAISQYSGTNQGMWGTITEAVGRFLKNEDPIKKFERFAQLKIDGKGTKENAEAFSAFGNAMSQYSGTNQGMWGTIVEAVGRFLGNPDPIKKFKEFADLDIDGANAKLNAEAFALFSTAMSTYKSGGNEGLWGTIGKGIASFFGGGGTANLPLAAFQEFAKQDIMGGASMDQLQNNAKAFTLFGNALSSYKPSGNEGIWGALTKGIAKALGAETPIDKFKAFAQQNLLEGSSMEQVENNAKAFSLFGNAMATYKGSQVGLWKQLTDGIGNALGNEDPIHQFKRFADLPINKEQAQTNAEAFTAFAAALASYTGTNIGMWQQLSEGVGNFLGNEDAVTKFNRFAALPISLPKVIENSDAFVYFANALKQYEGTNQGFWSSLGEGLANFFSGGNRDIIGDFERFSQIDASGVKDVSDSFGDMRSGLSNFPKDELHDAGAYLEEFADYLDDGELDIIDSASYPIARIGNAFASIANVQIGSQLSNATREIMYFESNMSETVGKLIAMNGGFTTISAMFTTLGNSLATFTNIRYGAITFIGAALSVFADQMTKLNPDGIIKSGNALTTFGGVLVQSFSETMANALLKTTVAFNSGFITGLEKLNTIATVLPVTSVNVSLLATSMAQLASIDYNAVANLGMAFVDNYGEDLIDNMEGITEQFNYGFLSGLERLNALSPMLPITAIGLTQLAQGFGQMASISYEPIEKLGQTFYDYFDSDFVDNMTGITAQLNSGFVAGMTQFASISPQLNSTADAIYNLATSMEKLASIDTRALDDIPWLKMTMFSKAGGQMIVTTKGSNNFNITQKTSDNIQKLTEAVIGKGGVKEDIYKLANTGQNPIQKVLEAIEKLIQVQVTGQEQNIKLVVDGKQMSNVIVKRNDNFKGQPPTTGTQPQPSDIRLKDNIQLIGKSEAGINIYTFEYIEKVGMNGVYQGVMAQELIGTEYESALIFDGEYYKVDYSKLDVEFIRIA